MKLVFEEGIETKSDIVDLEEIFYGSIKVNRCLLKDEVNSTIKYLSKNIDHVKVRKILNSGSYETNFMNYISELLQNSNVGVKYIKFILDVLTDINYFNLNKLTADKAKLKEEISRLLIDL